MPRIVDPRRRCLALQDWPEPDRLSWEAAMRGRRGRFSARGLAARLAANFVENTTKAMVAGSASFFIMAG